MAVVWCLIACSSPYMSVEALGISCAEAAVTLAPQAGDLKAEDSLSPFLLMCVFKKLNLF